MRKCLMIASGLLLAGCGLNAAAELVLVEGGVVRAPIVVAEGAPPYTRRAADELAVYIEKVSGARPEVIVGAPVPLPERVIWVGVQPKVEELFPEIDFQFAYPEEILIAANANHLVIAGRDRWIPGITTPVGKNDVAEDVQQEYGTANAVYTFLQDYLQVRWLWPGELGEDILKQDKIAFAPFEFRYHPQIRSRGGIFNYSRLGRGKGYGRSHDWVRLQRLQLDSLTVSGGHGFFDWWDRFHETHPEYFALQPDGTRSGYPSPGTAKMCVSNPAVWEQWMKEVEKQLEEDPARTVFNAAENDSWASGYCVCENCRAWDHPDGELRIFRWEGLNQEYVAMSDRQVTLANTLARKLKERYPDKAYYVSIAAYGHSRPAPLAAVPDKNVIVLSVANFLLRPRDADPASPKGVLHRDQFQAWGKVAPNLFWRPNKARKLASMPDISIAQTVKDFRFVAENHCVGIFIDMVWEHWATRGPFYYAMAQMAWNPWQDGGKMMEDYFRRGFGKAADGMKEYWNFMEKTWEKSLDKDVDAADLFNAEFFKGAYALLEHAEQMTDGQPEVYRRRVKFVRSGLDYTRMVTEAQALMVRFEQSGGTDTNAEVRAREIWMKEIQPLATDKENPYAISWGPTRPGSGHMKTGTFPKGLPSKW